MQTFTVVVLADDPNCRLYQDRGDLVLVPLYT
jgi:hypothetical protein